MKTLLSYETVSGLKTNFFKNKLIRVWVEYHIILPKMLKCRLLSNIVLGLPMYGSAPKSKWWLVLERVEERFLSWKASQSPDLFLVNLHINCELN